MCPKPAIPCNLLDPPEPARTTRKFRNLGVAPATVAPPRNQLNGSKFQENRAPWPGARPRPRQRVPFASAWTSSVRSAPRARVSVATGLGEPRAKLRWAPARGVAVQTLPRTVSSLINISKRDRRVLCPGGHGERDDDDCAFLPKRSKFYVRQVLCATSVFHSDG